MIRMFVLNKWQLNEDSNHEQKKEREKRYKFICSKDTQNPLSTTLSNGNNHARKNHKNRSSSPAATTRSCLFSREPRNREWSQPRKSKHLPRVPTHTPHTHTHPTYTHTPHIHTHTPHTHTHTHAKLCWGSFRKEEKLIGISQSG